MSMSAHSTLATAVTEAPRAVAADETGHLEAFSYRKVPLEGWVATVLFAALVSMMTAQVVLRFGFGIAVSWLEEVSRSTFVWAVYASFLVAAADDRHIRVALHLSYVPHRVQKLFLMLADVVWIAFNFVVIYGAALYCIELYEYPYMMPTTDINLLWVFLVVPLGFGLLSIRVGVNIRKRITQSADIRDSRLDV